MVVVVLLLLLEYITWEQGRWTLTDPYQTLN